MDPEHKYRMRVESCIGAILDVHRTLKEHFGELDFLAQFESLKETISEIDMSKVSEQDVQMVEKATNALLGEFRPIFEKGECKSVCQDTKH